MGSNAQAQLPSVPTVQSTTATDVKLTLPARPENVSVTPHVLHGTVDVAFEPGPRTLSLRVGPLRPGGGDALVVDAAVPGVGNVIEQLADELRVSPEGEREFLHVRLEYAGAAN